MFKLSNVKTPRWATFVLVVLCHASESQAFLGKAPLTPLQATTQQAYEALTPAASTAAFLSQANAEGAKGFWYLNDYCFGSCSIAVYAKNNTSNATFTYEALKPASSSADFVSTANMEGAKGYRYLGDYFFGTDSAAIYIKDSSKNTTFSYATMAPATSAADFINQANTQGAKGYGYYLDLIFLSNFDSVAIYAKDNSSNAEYSYQAITPASSSAGFITQANTEGAKGYGYYVDLSFNLPAKNSSAAIYVKNNATSATFNYEAVSPAKSSADFISQAHTEAAKGYGYYVDLAFTATPGDSAAIYVRNAGSSAINTANCLFNWAEVNYPGVFKPATQNTQQITGYDYRFYSGTNTYLGIYQGNNIHILQPNVSPNIVDVGTVAQFKPITGCQ